MVNPRSSYVVRIWLNTHADGSYEPRGEVLRVSQGGLSRPFCGWNGLLRHLRDFAEADAQADHGPVGSDVGSGADPPAASPDMEYRPQISVQGSRALPRHRAGFARRIYAPN